MEDKQMSKHSAVYFYLNWAKERIDEMDAVLASLEANVAEVQADARAKANTALADMRKKRDDFRDALKKLADANEAEWVSEKARLQSVWNIFETEVQKYVESAEQQQTTFKDQAAAQVKAWRDAAQNIRSGAKEFAVEHRGEIEATLKQMEADAAAAEEKLQKIVNEAGKQSWSALTTAMAETRAAFDRANKAVHDAFNRRA
jgi:paraquat-inducible protein B